MQASFNPPGLTVAVKKDRAVENLMNNGSQFVVNILSEGDHKTLMKQLLKKKAFDFRVNTSFAQVIDMCRQIERKGQDGTWITEEVMNAYIELHKLGYAHSAEVWQDRKLVGGLYGIRIGNIFFGESMFSHVSNASKYAFIRYVQLLKGEGVQMIDCQVHTEHLESLGARMIDRKEFIDILQRSL